MASLKDLRNRIASVKATQKITKAMQMVAAAKLRRAQDAAISARPYANRMSGVMRSLAGRITSLDDAPKLLAGTGRNKKHLLLLATAERGLCGGFNSSIAKLADRHAKSLIAEGKDVKILCIGRKGYDLVKRQHGSLILRAHESSPFFDFKHVRRMSFAEAEDVGRKVLAMFENEEFDVCTLFYAEFKSVMVQEPTALQLIPSKIADDGAAAKGKKAQVDEAAYDYEPDETEILADLLPRNVTTQIFRAMLENSASEQGARMSAMDSATRNAGDMIKRLTLQYNRSRQAQITKELIEIISGAEAL